MDVCNCMASRETGRGQGKEPSQSMKGLIDFSLGKHAADHDAAAVGDDEKEVEES